MNGYNEIYGAYATKEDKKLDLISAGKKMVEAFNRYDDPTFHAAKAYFSEICRIESRLSREYKMTEEEIYNVLWN